VDSAISIKRRFGSVNESPSGGVDALQWQVSGLTAESEYPVAARGLNSFGGVRGKWTIWRYNSVCVKVAR